MCDALRETTLGWRARVRHATRTSRKRRTFAKTQQHARREQRHQSACETSQYCRARPNYPADEQGTPSTEAVAEPAAAHLEHQIGIRKGRKNEADLHVAQTEFALERRRRRADVHT